MEDTDSVGSQGLENYTFTFRIELYSVLKGTLVVDNDESFQNPSARSRSTEVVSPKCRSTEHGIGGTT